MGRWDALKPEESKADGGSSKGSSRKGVLESGNRWKPQNSGDSTSRGNHQPGQATRNQTSAGQTNGKALSTILSNQLCYYRLKSKDFELQRTLRALEDCNASSKAALEKVSLVLLVDLLEIDDKAIQEKALNLVDRRLQDSKLASDEKVVECVQKLTKFAEGTARHGSFPIECLCRLISLHAKALPAEETAHKIVGPLFLPTLQVTQGDESICVVVCNTIEALLLQSKFASAILSPLVEDVSNDGKEETVANPIRCELFRSLQAMLFAEKTAPILQRKACATLACAIETLRKTDGTSNTMPIDLDQSGLEHFITRNLNVQQPMYHSSLLLLRALLRTYPKAMTQLGPRLFFPTPAGTNRAGRQKCTMCSCPLAEVSHFLRSVHDSIGTDMSGLSLDCTEILIRALPWELWLKRQLRQSVSGFYRKVVDSLASIILISRCAVLPRPEVKWDDELGRLCTTLFAEIPWEDDTLVRAGEELWSTLTAALSDPRTSSNSKSGIVAILISGVGGRVTPQGDLLPMALPARRYMASKDGMSFLEQIHVGISSLRDASSLELFCAVLRTRPETVVPLWGEFRGFVEQPASCDAIKVEVRLRLVESLLLGRRDFSSDELRGLEDTHSITKLAFDLLETLWDDSNVKIWSRSMNAYATLLKDDWEYLKLDHPRFTSHFDAMIRLCSDSKADVRRAACKAIGEFCCQSLTLPAPTEDKEQCATSTVASQICRTMLTGLKHEKNAAALAMSVFALGNLALVMSDHDLWELIPLETVVEIAGCIFDLLDDSNDKVAGNAIRSIGHWSSILARRVGEDRISSNDDHVQYQRTLVSIVRGLSLKVGRTLALTSPEQQATMSWKERSAAKKHGWGACHSLGRALGAITVWGEDDDDNVDVSENLEQAGRIAVQNLIQCLRYAAKLPEKVVLAAMTSLRSIKPLQLVRVTGKKSGLIGDALTACCALVFVPQQQQQQQGGSKVVQEGACLLLSHLLSCASISDVVIVIQHEETSTTAMLESLYQWMVEQDLEGRAFEMFSLGMQRKQHDVSLEQRFASRAVMQYKKEQSIAQNGGDNEEDDDCGGDEL